MAETDRKVFAICIGAAFAFWLILNLSQDYTIEREVSIDYLIQPDRVLVGNMPRDITADIAGQGWNLIVEGLRPGALPITVDVREEEDARLTSQQLRQQIERRLSSGALQVEDMDFESIPILTTPLAGKRVPIRAVGAVQPAPGYVVIDSFRLAPDSITINSANDVLDTIDFWPTVALRIDNLSGRNEGTIPLAIPPEGLTLSRPSVLYSVRAEPFIQRRITVPITVRNAATAVNFEISPQSVDIDVSIPQSAYHTLDVADFTVVADVSKLRDGNFSPEIALQITEQPADVVSAFLEQRTVTFYEIR